MHAIRAKRAVGTSLALTGGFVFTASLSFGGCTEGVNGTSDLGSSGGALMVESGHCRLEGLGDLPSGDVTFGEIHDEGGVPAGAWSYESAAGDAFVGTPDSLLCRVNGSNVADVRGTGVWNGVPGHFFMLNVQDFGPSGEPEIVPGPTETHTLTATRTYSPSRWTDGFLSFALGASVEIPDSMPVTVGNAGNQWTWLTFTEADSGEPIRCMYRGGASTANPRKRSDIERGQTVALERCQRLDETGEWSTDSSLVAGTELEVTEIVLHVQHGSSRYPSCHDAETTISIDLEVTPYIEIPRRPDFFRIAIFDPSGARVHLAEGDIVAGDFDVALMP